MKKSALMNISQFANATGIKRANLIFYDRIGLLHPEERGANNYRYYTSRQLSSAYLITALRSINISLDVIKEYACIRTPENMIRLFKEQELHIQQEIEKLKDMKQLMKVHAQMAEEIMYIDTNEIHVVEQREEFIFSGKQIPPQQLEEEAMIEFYDYAMEQNINPSYPFGAIISQESLLSASFDNTRQFYMKVPYHRYQRKPAGHYVVGYDRGDYGLNHSLLERLLKFIKEHSLIINGNAYEEYPLNEMSIQNADDYVIRLQIKIKDPIG